MHNECDSDHLFSVQAFYEQYSEWLDKFDHIHMVSGWIAVGRDRSDQENILVKYIWRQSLDPNLL